MVKFSYAGVTALSLTGTLLATQMRQDWKSTHMKNIISQSISLGIFQSGFDWLVTPCLCCFQIQAVSERTFS